MKKRLLSILLALCMVLALLPGEAWAAEGATSGTCGDDLTWSLNGGTLTISGHGPMYNYFIHLSHYNKTPAPWYLQNASITSIVISDGVTSIGSSAFYECWNLTSITIPNSVISIGDGAFGYCSSLTSITVPDSVAKIGWGAFNGCGNLTSAGPCGGGYSYEFGWTKQIPDNAFYGCNGLTDITIPNSMTSIGGWAFRDCSSLTNITIPNGVTNIGDFTFDGCDNLTSITIPNSVTSIGNRAFFGCSSLASVSIPDSVTSIGASAFYDCRSLTSIVIPDSVAKIGGDAFHGCSSLTSITIPDGITSIESGTFEWCRGLTSINIPNSVTNIGDGAFCGCSSLTNITIPDGITKIEHDTFYECSSLTNINIPNSVTSIGDQAFSYCSSLTNITIPDGVTSIGVGAFSRCSSLTNIAIPDGIINIADSVFFGCSSLASITIPANVIRISRSAFRECSSLMSIVIPNGAAYIGDNAFFGCSSLANITIPNSVTRIEYTAFSGCRSLTDVYYGGSEAQWQAIEWTTADFRYHLADATIHYNSTGPGTGDPGEKYTVYYGSNTEKFDYSLEDLLKVPSTSYNPQLAHMLIAMDNSVHDVEDMSRTFESFGFRGPVSHIISPGSIMVGYGLGKKIIGNLGDEKTIILVVVRGTTDLLEWASNLDASTNALSEHGGFSDAANALYDQVVKLLGTNDFSNVKFVITGHSRGAAAANILAKRLVNETGRMDNIYAYTFACPDTAIITNENASRYQNIFNINNINDPISWIPSSIWRESGEKDGHGVNSYWNKYGRSYWFCSGDTWEDHRIILDRPSSISTLIGMANRFTTVHPQNLYLDYLRKELSLPSRAYKNRAEAIEVINASAEKRRQGVRVENIKNIYGVLTPESVTMLPEVTVFCPVDVEIYRSTGELVGKITDNIVSNVDTDKVYISVSEDDKYIYPLDDGIYTLKLTGTDNGTMTYSVQNVDIKTSSTVGEQTFQQVALSSGKQFASEITVEQNIAAEVTTQSVKLYVMDSTGEPEKEVLPDGAGTEVPITPTEPKIYTITLDPAGGLSTLATLTTNEDGKLTALPTPTRDGYTFEGWYTSIDGEEEITTETVFEKDATIYAHWKEIVTPPTPEIFTVTFDPNGGAVTPASFTTDEDGKLAILPVPTRNGYNFEGWYTSVDGGEMVTTETVFAANATVHARWKENTVQPKPDTYTVTFDANGGTVIPATMVTNDAGKLSTLPTPSRNSYQFSGWYTAAIGGTQITTSTVFSADAVIYAHWIYTGSGSGGGGASSGFVPSGNNSSNYNISISAVDGGAVTVTPKSAAKDRTVTITVVPDVGYELTSLNVMMKSGSEVALSDKGGGKYTFTMPGSDATITAAFHLISVTEPDAPAESVWKNPYIDVVSGTWYYDAVEFVSKNGLMNGTSGNVFAPDDQLSRAMLAQILYNKAGKPNIPSSNIFTDVENNAWYTDAVTWAVENHIVSGYGDGTFGPNDKITREQLAVMLWRYAGEPIATTKELHFADASTVSNYALGALCWATENKIINGYNGELMPQESATRAQIAQTLSNYLK